MEHTSSRANRCAAGSPAPKASRMVLLAEIAAFTREHGDILARYHTYTMDDLKKIEKECWNYTARRAAGAHAGVPGNSWNWSISSAGQRR